jgi:GNAT superfamily N-acetyltransferase
VRQDPGLAAVDPDGTVAGFATVVRPFPQVAEIAWMGVRRDRRGEGVGTALVGAVRAALEREGVRLLLVKTLSERHSDAGYAATRAFYRACGFLPAQELDIWGPRNPCLLLVLAIDPAPGSAP